MDHERMLSTYLIAFMALMVSGCAPAAVREVARPVVVVVAGPTERPLADLDGALRQALRREGFAGSFGPEILGAIAERRNLGETQAVRTAAELGRIGGGDVALYVEVARLERRVVADPGDPRRFVAVTLQLRATLVDPVSGALLWSMRDAVRESLRFEVTTALLAPLRTDPGALALRDVAVGRLAADVMSRLDVEGF